MAADICNPLVVKEQLAAFKSKPLPCNDSDLASLLWFC
jgi:hypothetical protein